MVTLFVHSFCCSLSLTHMINLVSDGSFCVFYWHIGNQWWNAERWHLEKLFFFQQTRVTNCSKCCIHALLSDSSKHTLVFANRFTHAVLTLRAREQPMEPWRGLFHNASRWEMADPLFSRPTSLWARVPAASPLQKRTPASQAIFSSLLCDHFSSLSLPLLRAPLPPRSPLAGEPGWGRSCRHTARKHAAATIIALIAHFFCWAEINCCATTLSKPQNLQVKMAGGKLKKKKKTHSGVYLLERLLTYSQIAHTCVLTPPLK